MKEEIKDKIWWYDKNDGRLYNWCKVGDNRFEIIKVKDLAPVLDNLKQENEKLKETNSQLDQAYYLLMYETGRITKELCDKHCKIDF
jgi:hypothetical protein